MKHYAVTVCWQVCGTVYVDAESPEQARTKALADDTPLPTKNDYVMDSVNCDADCDVREVQERVTNGPCVEAK